MSGEKRDLLKLKRAMLSLWVYMSKMVNTLIAEAYETRIGAVAARGVESDDDKVREKCEDECMELFKEMKRELNITEKSIFDVEAPIGS